MFKNTFSIFSKYKTKPKNSKKIPFNDIGYNVVVLDDGNNGLSRSYRYIINDLIIKNLFNPASRNLIILCQPRQYKRLLRKNKKIINNSYRIGYWVSEFSKLQDDWLFALEIVDEIWVPSKFSAIALSETKKSVSIFPYQVKIEEVQAFERELFGFKSNHFLIYTIIDLNSLQERKNLDAYFELFSGVTERMNNSKLVLKLRFPKKNNTLRNKVKNEIDRNKNIILIEKEFSDSDMIKFMKMADVFLSLHRAEGYGLCINEMLILGKPVIATGWSGNVEFMTQYKNAFLLPYKLEKIKVKLSDNNIFEEYWAEPDLLVAKEHLLSIYLEWSKDFEQEPLTT